VSNPVRDAGVYVRRTRVMRLVILSVILLGALLGTLDAVAGLAVTFAPLAAVLFLIGVATFQTVAFGRMEASAGRRYPLTEPVLRRIAHRPRRVMTPADYERLREMEAELGWEPSEPLMPGKVSSRAVPKVRPLNDSRVLAVQAAPYCQCGDDRGTVEVRAPASTLPVAYYCTKCGHRLRELKAVIRAEKRAAAAADRTIAETRAALHFAELAKVGREFCVSYCPICSHRIHEIAAGSSRWPTGHPEHVALLNEPGREFCVTCCPICAERDRAAEPSTWDDVARIVELGHAKLPAAFREATIASMKPGRPYYTVPWAMQADENGALWLRRGYTAWDCPGGTAQMRVERRDDGYHVWPVPGERYAPEALHGQRFISVAVLEGKL